MTSTYNGITYFLDPESDLDRHIIENGAFEQHLVDVAARLVPPDGVIFDIGANAGLLSLPFAQIACDGRVFAFEPDAEMFAALQRNVELNPLLRNRIYCHKSAVQDDPEVACVKFNVRRYGGNRGLSSMMEFICHNVKSFSVHAVTVDEMAYHAGRVDLIKIDVEGAEAKVLRGGLKALEKHKPAVIWECSNIIDQQTNTSNTEEAFALLDGLGYCQSIIQKDGTLKPLQKWHSKLNYVDILAAHPGKVVQ